MRSIRTPLLSTKRRSKNSRGAVSLEGPNGLLNQADSDTSERPLRSSLSCPQSLTVAEGKKEKGKNHSWDFCLHSSFFSRCFHRCFRNRKGVVARRLYPSWLGVTTHHNLFTILTKKTCILQLIFRQNSINSYASYDSVC